MAVEHKPPLLLEILFGELANGTQGWASGRLLAWVRLGSCRGGETIL